MCTIILGFQVHPCYPLVVAANRDEATGRTALPPHLLSEHPWIFAGQDLLAGGTWLGMTPWGVIGLTNYPTQPSSGSVFRSRGQLMLDLLRQSSLSSACEELLRQEATAYLAFNVFIADPAQLRVFYLRDGIIHEESPGPGWHVLPNGRINERGNHKVIRARQLLHELEPDSVAGQPLVERLRTLLADDVLALLTPPQPAWLEPPGRRALSSLCVHTPAWGTQTYSVLLLGGNDGPEFWFGEGKPCKVAPYKLILTGYGEQECGEVG